MLLHRVGVAGAVLPASSRGRLCFASAVRILYRVDVTTIFADEKRRWHGYVVLMRAEQSDGAFDYSCNVTYWQIQLMCVMLARRFWNEICDVFKVLMIRLIMTYCNVL